jgi:hypothetical protein
MLRTMPDRRRHSQLMRPSINDQWGESTRLGFDELCARP